MPLTAQAQTFLEAVAALNRPGWEELTPEQGREVFNALGDLFGEGPPISRVEDRSLPNGVDVRIYADPRSAGSVGLRQPVVMFFHGGGWVLGNLETHDSLCRRLAKESGCTIVAVDYPLSPEARFPQALQQCYDATMYVVDHADELGVLGDSLAVLGDSAGGNLAAALAMKSRDEGGPAIKLQVLLYPVIEPNFETETYKRFGEKHGLSRANMKWFWQQYLGDQQVVALAAPSRAASLTGLPPAHVVTAEYDVLRSEGEGYARSLSAAGVPTTTRRYDGNLHGFMHFAGMFDDGVAATRDVGNVLKQHLFN